MLLESKGTPDILLNIIKDYESQIINSSKKLDYIIMEINNPNLVTHLKINFKKDGDMFYGNLNFKDCIESNFDNCIININVPRFDISLIIKTLMHELTHLYELYQIKDIYHKTRWNRTEVLYDTRNQNVDDNLRYFRDIFYLSLPFEVNARVSSIYKFLSDTKIKDKDKLEKIIIKTTEWKNMENLNNFPYFKLYNNLINKYKMDKVFLYEIFNIFNSKMGIKTIIHTDLELYNYLKNSKRYFKSVSLNYKKKLLKVLYRVVKDNLYEGYWTSPTIIVNYKDYQNDIVIDYMKYL